MREGALILALDLATIFGWALGAPGGVMLKGSGRFGRPAGHEGAIAGDCLVWASDFLAIHKPSVIIIEEPKLFQNARRPTNKATLRRLWGLSVVVEAVAALRGIYDVRTVTADEVRKHFLGTPNLDGETAKRRVQERCRKLGWEFKTPDEADALAVWDYGCELVKPGSGHPWSPMLFSAGTVRAPRKKGGAPAPIPERMTAKEANALLFKQPKGGRK